MKVGETTIGQLLSEMAGRFPEQEALVYVEPDVRYTYSEFDQACSQFAKSLLRLGIEKGEHVAIWANNVPEWVIAQFATARIGAVLVTVNTSYRAVELEYLLKQSDSRTLILISGVRGDEYLTIVRKLCPELADSEAGQLHASRVPLLRKVIFIGEERPAGMLAWDEVFEQGQDVGASDLRKREAELGPDDVINMQYTSGTTGFPKGVMLTHTNLIGNASSIAEGLNFSPVDRLCIPVPLFHCFGCVLGTLVCVVSGATMVLVVSFDPSGVLNSIERESCTAVHGVPTMFIAMLEEHAGRPRDTSSLRTGIMAGSPCPIEVMKSVVDRLGAEEICIVYGLTEASPGVTMTRVQDPLEVRVQTAGRALPNVEVKIIEADSGRALPAGVQGELCTRGYHVMPGYYKMPEATARAVDEEGWLHTGDLAVMDANGYCRITGRSKDMIIRGGENIYPREVEEFLYTHPKIKDVQVVGVPSSRWGEEVAAFIQLKSEEDVDEAEIRDYCVDQISYYKVPSLFFFVEDYPKTASGKIQKYKLREQAITELGREQDSQEEMA